jgi:outer membrane immunogenic protein
VKSLKLTFLGATFLAGAGVLSAANAADVYARGSLKDGPEEYMPAITWTGFYIGANAGGAFSNNDNNDNSDRKGDDRGDDDDDDTTFIGGIHAGYNWQRANNLLFGIEADVDFADDIDYLATVRGRLGWTAGSVLFYGTGGVAFIGFDNSFDDDSQTGWVAGGGIEYKLRENVSVGVEGLYYNFEDNDNSDDFNFWTVRARLTYHFGDHFEPLK